MMKNLKLAVCSLVLFGAASLMAKSRCRDNSCNESCEPKCNPCADPQPCCVKTVTYKVPAKKVREQIAYEYWKCPDGATVVGTHKGGEVVDAEGNPVKGVNGEAVSDTETMPVAQSRRSGSRSRSW